MTYLLKDLFLNNRIIIKKLRNGKKYILVKQENEFKPLLLKESIIDLLWNIKQKSSQDNEQFDPKIIDLLLKCKIISNNVNTNEYMPLEDNNHKARLDVLSVTTRSPLYTKFEITYRCNFQCKYCYINNSRHKELTFNEIKIIIDKLINVGINELYITGGEPFLHPDIMEVIDYVQTKDVMLIIQTNGYYIDEDIAKRLCKYKYFKIDMSFHSSLPNEFDDFTGVKGSFNKLIDTCHLLKKYNISYTLKHMVTSVNQKNAKSNIEFLEKNKINFEVYNQILPNVNDFKDTSQYCVDSDVLRWLYEKEYCKFDGKHNCSALKNKMWINPLGDIYACEMYRHSIGNIVEEDFEKIWNNSKVEDILGSCIYKEPEVCIKCDKKQYCNKCLAYLTYENWSSGLKQFCERAKVISSIYG